MGVGGQLCFVPLRLDISAVSLNQRVERNQLALETTKKLIVGFITNFG